MAEAKPLNGKLADEIFTVMARASVGEVGVRVAVGEAPALEEPFERFAVALNLLLDDLEWRVREGEKHARIRAENEARKRLLAVVSHEMRTPLNGIVGMTSLLLDTTLDEGQREMMETVRQSGGQLLTIINDILDFTDLDASRVSLEAKAFDPRQVLADTLEFVAARAAQKGIELHAKVDPSTPRKVIGDETRVRQVLVNILGNAVKFTPHGDVSITLREARQTEPGERCITFEVEDSGPGITEEDMPRLFRPFAQLGALNSNADGGVGLGLTIASELISLMRGRIEVMSEEGRGSVFSVTVPAAVAAEGDPASMPMSVLVVTEQPKTAENLKTTLNSWGMSCVIARDEEGATRAIECGAFDAVIIDPKNANAGLGFASRLRAVNDARRVASNGARDLSAVVLVPYGTRRGNLGAQEGGPVQMLTKPCRASKLFDALANTREGQFESGPLSILPPPPGEDDRVPLRVLIAEDNRVNQRVMTGMLERLGYRADLASDGVEAMDAVIRQQYDLVLMDVHMPRMTGIEATTKILERFAGGHRPRIIAITADVSSEDRNRCLAAGMDGFATKPITLASLKQLLEAEGALAHQARIEEREKSMRAQPEVAAEAPVEAIGGQEEIGGQEDLGPHITASILNELVDTLGAESFRDVCEEFFADAPRLVLEIEQGVAMRSFDAVRRAAHQLKANLGIFGAEKLNDVATTLEGRAKEHASSGAVAEDAEAAALAARLSTGLNPLIRELRARIERGLGD